MAKVRYLVRLYSSHDLDLVTFTLTHDFDIVRAIYSSLKAFAKGEQFIIKVPPVVRTLPGLKRVYAKVLFLDTEKDKETVELMEKIVPGKRNNFLKNLLRLYLAYPFSECFFEASDDFELFERKLSVFREGRREVKAGKTGRLSRQKRELSSLKSTAEAETTQPISEKRELSSQNGGNQNTTDDKIVDPISEPQETLTDDRPETVEVAGTEDADAILALFEGL